MDITDLEKYCTVHSIRMTCRICNRPPSPKVEMHLVSPSDSVYGTIKFCGITQITRESCEIFLCRACSTIIYQCALSIYYAKSCCACHDTRYIICRVCNGTIGLKEFVIDSSSNKYEAILRLVEGSMANPIWICKPCDDLLQDLSELYEMAANTTIDNEPAPSTSKTSSLGDKKTPSKPIDIPNPKPRARMWQSSEDSEDEDVEFKNNIFSDLFLPRSLTYIDVTNENVETKGNIPHTVASQNLSKWFTTNSDNEVGPFNNPSLLKQPKTQQNNTRDCEDDFFEPDVIDEELANLLNEPFIMADPITTCVGTPDDGAQSSDAAEGDASYSDEDSDEPIYMRSTREASDVDPHDNVQLLDTLSLKQRKITQETCEEVIFSNCDIAASDDIKVTNKERFHDTDAIAYGNEDVEFKNNIFSNLSIPRSLMYTDVSNENIETKGKIPRTVASQNLSKWFTTNSDDEVSPFNNTSLSKHTTDCEDDFSESDVINEELANLLNEPFIMADPINTFIGTPDDGSQSSDVAEEDASYSGEDSDEPIYMRSTMETSDVDSHNNIQLLETLFLKLREIIQGTIEEVIFFNCDTASSDDIKVTDKERSLMYTDVSNENIETKGNIPRTVASQNLCKLCTTNSDDEDRPFNNPSSSKQPKTQQNNTRDCDDDFSEPDVIDEELVNFLNDPFIMADPINTCVGTPDDGPRSSDAAEGDASCSDEDSDEPIYMRSTRGASDVDSHNNVQLLDTLFLKLRKILQGTFEEVKFFNCDIASSDYIKVTGKERFNDRDAIADGDEDVEFKNSICSNLFLPRSLMYTDVSNENIETKGNIPRTVASQNLCKLCTTNSDDEDGPFNNPSSSKQPTTLQNNTRDYEDNFSEPGVIDEELAISLNALVIMADPINTCNGTTDDAPQSSDAAEGGASCSDEDSDEPIYMRPASEAADVDPHDNVQLLDTISLKQRKIIQEICEEAIPFNCDTASSDAIKNTDNERFNDGDATADGESSTRVHAVSSKRV